MQDGKPSWRRRKYLINPEFQLTVMGFFIGLGAVTIVVFFFAFRLIFGNFIDQAKEMGLPPGHPIFQFLLEQQSVMNLIILTTSILLFVFLIVGGLILSHQIAGPLHRLRIHMEKVAENDDFSRLSFRKKDFFQELLPPINKVLDKIRKQDTPT